MRIDYRLIGNFDFLGVSGSGTFDIGFEIESCHNMEVDSCCALCL